jgi:tetraacyldisaccharide 4'-kinase
MSHRRQHELFLDIVSGRRSGIDASLLRGGLWLLSLPYRAFMAARSFYYRFAAQRVDVPVISVGNLTVGGTGKSPLVALVARRLAELGHRPLVVSRGYRRTGDGPGDEAADMRRHLPPSAAHVESSDRVAAIRQSLAREARDVAVLDDGFQHLRLRRDLDIVAIDATRPFGYGHCLPRGLLREPLAALRRAGLVVLTRSDQVGAEELAAIESRVRCYVRRDVLIVRAVHAPRQLTGLDGKVEPPTALRGAKVLALSGIANPAAFARTLESLGATLVARREFADHHAYTAADVREVARAAAEAGAERIVTTSKDFVKLAAGDARTAWPDGARVVALEIEMELTGGATLLDGIMRLVVGEE